MCPADMGLGCDLALRDARPPISGEPEIGALAPQGEVAPISALILKEPRGTRGASKDGRTTMKRVTT